jgi:hypothetical protein
MIRDGENRLKDVELAIKKINSIQQLQAEANLKQVIDKINEITNSLKRLR